MAAVPLETWFYEIPICTRWWASASVVTAVACQCRIISPFQLFFSLQAVWGKRQYWRLITTFLYFGPLTLDFIFHMFFMARYSRMLEESFFRGRTADFAWLILYSASCLLVSLAPTSHAPLGSDTSKSVEQAPALHLLSRCKQKNEANVQQFFSATIVSMPFLGSPLAFSLVYIWSRRNPGVRLSFLGLFVFNAPYLPWVLLGFTLLLNNQLPKEDLLGILVGHVYFFFMDIYPVMRGGSRPLDPPEFWRRLFEPRVVNAVAVEEQHAHAE